MLLTIGLQLFFVSFCCVRNLALFLGFRMNQHDDKAFGIWWRTLRGLRACPRFFLQAWVWYIQAICSCVCVYGMRSMIIGTMREKFDSGCYRIHMFFMVSSDWSLHGCSLVKISWTLLEWNKEWVRMLHTFCFLGFWSWYCWVCWELKSCGQKGLCRIMSWLLHDGNQLKAMIAHERKLRVIWSLKVL